MKKPSLKQIRERLTNIYPEIRVGNKTLKMIQNYKKPWELMDVCVAYVKSGLMKTKTLRDYDVKLYIVALDALYCDEDEDEYTSSNSEEELVELEEVEEVEGGKIFEGRLPKNLKSEYESDVKLLKQKMESFNIEKHLKQFDKKIFQFYEDLYDKYKDYNVDLKEVNDLMFQSKAMTQKRQTKNIKEKTLRILESLNDRVKEL